MSLLETHKSKIERAIEALHSRTFYAAFPENPSPAVYGETADADGQAKFKQMLGKKFEELKQATAQNWEGQEESPYLQEPLKISYPIYTVKELIDRSGTAFNQWRNLCLDRNVFLAASSQCGRE